jgi:hypothetical protein
MAIKIKETGKHAKTRTKQLFGFVAKERTAKQPEKELFQLALANLLHGGRKFDPPDFPPTERPFEPTAEELAKFQRFADMHFPRRKFAALRQALDEASRSTSTNPIQFYGSIWETREALRSAARTMNFICSQMGLRRPPLQICEQGCGKLFILQRQNQYACSERCSARARVARGRADKALHEEVRKSMIARGAAGVARDFEFRSEERLGKFLRRTFPKAEVQRVLADRARRKKPVPTVA